MRKKRSRSLEMLMVAAAVLFGQASVAGGDEVSVAGCGGSAALRVGERLTIRLASQATSGFLWHLVSKPTGMLTSLGESEPELEWPCEQPDVDGGSGVQLFRFRADKEGEDVLLFHNLRPASPDHPPLEVCSVSVKVSAAAPL